MRSARRGLAMLALVALLPATAFAHETRPGFLELRETAPDTYSLLWKKPSGGEVEIDIAPVVPDGCVLSTLDRQQIVPGAAISRATLTCDDGLAGKTLSIAGLEATVTDVLVRVHHADGRLESHLLRPTSPRVELGGATSSLAARRFVPAARRPAHRARRRSPAVRARPAPHRQATAGCWPRPSPRSPSRTRSRSPSRPSATPARRRRRSTPRSRSRSSSSAPRSCAPGAASRASRSAIRGWSRSLFGLLHGFGFASGLTTLGLPRAEFRWRCCSSTSASSSASWRSWRWCCCCALVPHARVPLAAWAEALPGYAVGGLGAMWTIQRLVALSATEHDEPRATGAAPSVVDRIVHLVRGVAAGRSRMTSRGRRSASSPVSRHPVSGLDHVLAMIAVGLWGAQLGPPALWLLPVTSRW